MSTSSEVPSPSLSSPPVDPDSLLDDSLLDDSLLDDSLDELASLLDDSLLDDSLDELASLVDDSATLVDVSSSDDPLLVVAPMLAELDDSSLEDTADAFPASSPHEIAATTKNAQKRFDRMSAMVTRRADACARLPSAVLCVTSEGVDSR